MRVAKLYSVDDIRIEDVAVPKVGVGEALVKTKACGICTGDLMGWYMARKAPLVFGHEPAGEIVEVGAAIQESGGPRVGDRVFVHHHAPCGHCKHCLRGHHVHCKTWRETKLVPGGMAEYFVVPEENLTGDTLVLPDSLSFDQGSLVEPTACVVKSVSRAHVESNDTVVVIGVGIMGQLHVAIAAARGARVIALDRVEFRLQRAREFGAVEAINVDNCDVVSRVNEVTAGDMADVVIVGPGSVEVMKTGIELAAPGGRVVLFTCTEPDAELRLSPFSLYFDEISLIPSYSCGPNDTREAVDLLERGVVDADQMITHRFALEDIGEAMSTAADVNRALKTIVVFD